MSHRELTTIVRGVKDGSFDDAPRVLRYPGDDTSTGIGMFINKDAYDKYIEDTYGDDLRKLDTNINDPSVSDDFIMFEIGKTALLMILAQEKCEGIRMTRIKNQAGNISFIVQGIVSEKDPGTGIPLAVRNDDDETITEEIHGSSLRQARSLIVGPRVAPISVTGKQLADLLLPPKGK